MNQLVAVVQSQKIHISDLPLFPVGADGLSELAGVTDDVQHIVPDLEGQPQLVTVLLSGFPGSVAAASRRHAQHTGSGDHGTGFQVVDLRHLRLRPAAVERIQHLPGHHAVSAGGVCQNQSAVRPLGVRQAGSRQDQAVCLRLEGVRYPVNLRTGSGMSVSGTVASASNSVLTEVEVAILDAADQMNGMTDQMKDLIGMLPTAPTTYAQLVYNSELLDYQAEQVLLMGDSLTQISPEQMHIKVIDANRAALEAGAQSAMIGYKQLLLNEESLESGLTLLNAVYQSTQNQAANGLATQSQVLSARQQLESTQATKLTLTANEQKLRQTLCTMLGWKYDAVPEIRDVPAAEDVLFEMLKLADSLRNLCGIQLTENHHGGQCWIRGAYLQTRSMPLNDYQYLMQSFKRIEKMQNEKNRCAALHQLNLRQDPGDGNQFCAPGTYEGFSHVSVWHSWEEDPGYLKTPFIDHSVYTMVGLLHEIDGWYHEFPMPLTWALNVTVLYGTPLEMTFTGLDPEASYGMKVFYPNSFFRAFMGQTALKDETLVNIRAGKVLLTDRIAQNPNGKSVRREIEAGREPFWEYDLPKESYQDGTLKVRWEVYDTLKALAVSEVWIMKKE